MMETKDYISGFVGILIMALGLLPLLAKIGVGPSWFALQFLPISILSWIIAVAALYLVMNSVSEITNSNSLGYISILVAFVVLAIGVLPILASFGIGPAFFALGTLPFMPIVYNVVFIIEGLFLFLAMFAMAL